MGQQTSIPAPSDTRYEGIHTSLYQTLPETSIVDLERAIHLTELGLFADAHYIYDGPLAELKDTPVVAIEHADVFFRQGKFIQAAGVLRRALAAVEKGGWGFWRKKSGEMVLMRMFLATVEYWSEGQLKPTLEAAKEMIQWLGNVEVAEYTDIQVSAMRRYLHAIHNMARNSNYVDTHVHGSIPKPSGEAIPWAGVTDLYNSLVARGNLPAAYAYLRVARAVMPIPTRAATLDGLIDACEKAYAAAPSDYVLLRVTLNALFVLAETLIARGQDERALEQIVKAEGLCRLLPDVLDEEQKQINAHAINIAMLRFRLMPGDDADRKWAEGTRLLALFKKAGNFLRWFIVASPLQEAVNIDSAGKPLSVGKMEAYMNMFRERQQYGHEFGHLEALLSDQQEIVSHNCGHLPSLPAALDWFPVFFRRYPNFAIPGYMFSAWQWCSLGYAFLQSDDMQELCHKEMEKWRPHLPTSETAAQPQQDPTRNAPIHFDDADQWNLQWTRIALRREDIHINVSGNDNALVLLLERMRTDLADGVVTSEHLWKILHPAAYERRDDLTFLPGVKEDLAGILHSMTLADFYDCVYGADELVPAAIWNFRRTHLNSWLERYKALSTSTWEELTAGIHEIRARSLARKAFTLSEATDADSLRGLKLLDDGIATYRECIEIGASFGPSYNVALDRIKKYRTMIGIFLYFSLHYFPEELDRESFRRRLEEAHQNYQGSDLFLSEDGRGYISFSAAIYPNMVDLACLRYKIGIAEPDWQLQPMQRLRQFDASAGSARAGLVAPHTLGLVEELGLREQTTAQQFKDSIPQLAIKVLRTGLQQDDREARVELWEWLQKAKARSLAEMMSLSANAPSGLLQDMTAAENKLLDEDRQIRESIDSSNGSDRHHLMFDLGKHRKEMLTHPKLAALVALREGSPLKFEELSDLVPPGIEAQKVVFVDWFAPQDDRHGVYHGLSTCIQLVATRTEGTPEIYNTGLALGEVERLVEQIIPHNLGKLSSMETMQHNFDPLVAPLAKCSNPDDVLIFCPTRVLGQIPLHALRIDKELVIKRNPVVYTPSMAVMRYAGLSRKPGKSGLPLPRASAFFTAPWRPSEGKTDGGHVADLAKAFSAPFTTNESATKKVFLEKSETTKLIHYHGHAQLSEDGHPLGHKLSFAGDTEDEHFLTAKEIFSHAFGNRSHLTMIACSSGLARQAVGDEVMGLVPALLHSGVSSTISTLWDTDTQVGKRFSLNFYDGWTDDSSGGRTTIDLARAFQRAVIALAHDRTVLPNDKSLKVNTAKTAQAKQRAVEALNPPLYWASLVLTGWWMFDFGTREVEEWEIVTKE